MTSCSDGLNREIRGFRSLHILDQPQICLFRVAESLPIAKQVNPYYVSARQLPTFVAMHFGAWYRPSPGSCALQDVVMIVVGRKQFRSMCGTSWVDGYHDDSIHFAFPPRHRHSRLQKDWHYDARLTIACLSSAHNPQLIFRPLPTHNRARSSVALSQQSLNIHPRLAHQACFHRSHSRLVGQQPTTS